jgi:hypothetical protein
LACGTTCASATVIPARSSSADRTCPARARCCAGSA